MEAGLGGLLITADGVYKPTSPKLDAALFGLALLLLPLLTVALHRPFASVWLSWAIVILFAIVRWRSYRRYGALGRPLAALREGTLVLALPQDSRGHVALTLAEFKELVVYGLAGRRTCRFIRHDGSFVELTPLWRPATERAVLVFLHRSLAPAIRVTEQDPQTLFASIRGDGP